MSHVLVIKTAALGDVLRTTAILPGLHALYPGRHVTWLTAPDASELVSGHPGVARVLTVELRDRGSLERVGALLGQQLWEWVLSLDEEQELCALASTLRARHFSGARLDAGGRRVYTSDVAPWFDMGLISVHGKAEADRRKLENRRSHAAIFTSMLGLPMGSPELHLPQETSERARGRLASLGLAAARPLIGINTGAGGRWPAKELSSQRTVELVERLQAVCGAGVGFLLLGGVAEEQRNERILARLAELPSRPSFADGGCRNSIPEFAALVSACDLLLASDSLAMHVAIARRVPVVAFFAPTSAAEIELFGRGEKVLSTAADYASYRPDADRSTITAERLAAAAVRVLERRPAPNP